MRFSIDSLLDGMAGVVYLTDADGRIVNLGRHNWNAFARANNGHALIDGETVLRRSVFDCVAGKEVRACYERCFKAILDERLEFIRVMSRCDSPVSRRQLWITMRPVQFRRRVGAAGAGIGRLRRAAPSGGSVRLCGARRRCRQSTGPADAHHVQLLSERPFSAGFGGGCRGVDHCRRLLPERR
ncbi:MAG: hypothetical protein HWD60_19455 [Defluviicoccus sp.]|nr:MAG: hypothetical protein HWD60_19455 [Defluviicoccus sp.]